MLRHHISNNQMTNPLSNSFALRPSAETPNAQRPSTNLAFQKPTWSEFNIARPTLFFVDGIYNTESSIYMNAAIKWGCLVFFTAVGLAGAATTNVIYSLGGEEDGEYADTDLAIDSAGNLYGTTVLGGTFGGGTVFKVTPTANGWVHTVLYSFTGGFDGGEPYKGVTVDVQGNLYGTAVTGGSGSCEGGCGVAYKLTNSGGTWTQTVIHAFTGGNDGSGPGAGLTLDNQGNLYGMAPTGGAYGLGTIYQLHPDQTGNYNLKVIHTFTGGADGATGSAGRMLLHQKRLYGVATAGGINAEGVAFELTPTLRGEW